VTHRAGIVIILSVVFAFARRLRRRRFQAGLLAKLGFARGHDRTEQRHRLPGAACGLWRDKWTITEVRGASKGNTTS